MPNSFVSGLRLPGLGRFLHRAPPPPAEAESPLRAELFALSQLESHARLLAAGHEISLKPGPERLLQRLRENERIIRESYQAIVEAVRAGLQTAPAAEWLLDNFYLVEEQIDIAREHLPAGYSRQLPRLRTGRLEGHPRVYELAFELVSHTDGRVDMENLSRFIRAYQGVGPLRMGELWAVPIMLRLALLENLRRVAYRIASRRRDRDRALGWVKQFLDVVQTQPRNLITALADFVREAPPLSQAFIAEVAAGLQGQHASLALVTGWLEQELAEKGQTCGLILQAESHDQAADQVSIGNSITSLRTLTALDWQEFVESLSMTEAELRRDPVGVYAAMDFRTRDRYRHVVEHLARRTGRDEQEVAAAVVELAAHRKDHDGRDLRASHVGYFLIGPGLGEFEQSLGYRPPLQHRAARWLGRHAFAVYLPTVVAATVALAAALVVPAADLWARGWAWTLLVAAATVLVASQTAVWLVHWVATLLVPARGLPRMDFSKGIPPEHRAVVTIPTLLTSAGAVDDLIEGLQIRHLANRGGNLLWALLTDFPDAPTETMPDDAHLLARAVEGIHRLNAEYAEAGETLFFLLHRPRRWNGAEGVWMGYERKRGKLTDFNRLLRGGPTEAFGVIVGDLAGLQSARYVITLDTDTQLPPESAWKMVGSIAHPLNQPRLDPATRRVEAGYGVLQPRVAVSLTGAARTVFSRLFAGEVGIDPYTREVSNVYHDLFARSPFIGKGIYDVEVLDATVGQCFPENRILSHDLLEGCHARGGFLNDVELIEDHPSSYLADVSRRHRWIRGDWQIAPWLFGGVPGPDGRRIPNAMGGLAQWLIFDNLRRSLVPPAFLALLVTGWFAMADSALAWTLGLLALHFGPEVLRTVWVAASKPRKFLWGDHVRRSALDGARQLAVKVLGLAFLPFEALFGLDAIAHVLWRTCVSHRHLLTWQTASDAERNGRLGLGGTLRAMEIAPVAAAVGMAAVFFLGVPERVHPAVLAVAALVLSLWLNAPLLAWSISLRIRPPEAHLTADESAFLHRLARRTWTYFEHFVGPDEHHLPPDNFQEQPKAKIAERTSPTNIGLALVSDLAAHDFGYLSTGGLLMRVQQTFATLGKLPRYRGHFYNWYDTWTCQPLHPAYVSTVDSGNLAACLITLRGGLKELAREPGLPARWRQGLQDTAGIVLEEMDRALAAAEDLAGGADLARVADAVRNLMDGLGNVPDALPEAEAALGRLATGLAEVEALAQGSADVAFWVSALKRQAEGLRGDLVFLAPWLGDGGLDALLPAPPEGGETDDDLRALREELARVRSLKDLVGLDHAVEPILGRLASRGRGDAALDAAPPDAADSQAARPAAALAPERLDALRGRVADAVRRAAQRLQAIDGLAVRADELATFDLDFLYNPSRKLLSIGFALDGHRLDPGYYDLLGSEARLISYLAVAQGRLPQEHWFLLGRQLTPGSSTPALLSWSGSMFEYLMPLLFMPTFEGTLLDRACRGAVARQIRYGRRQRVPWGMSESCYNQVDAQKNYQYRAFGVPELGLKRGLGDDLVVAPYASAMALMVAPEEACDNLMEMARLGLVGRFGLYEAIDYTPIRLPADQHSAIVRAFMAHHSGMSLVAMANALLDRPMQRRFMDDPEVRASILLLQERVPTARATTRQDHRESPLTQPETRVGGREAAVRTFATADLPVPEVHLLSNGTYNVMVTSAGGGFSRWHDLALTRWREDPTRDAWGSFLYLQDVEDRHTWSCMHQPLRRKVDRYEVTFSQARAEFRTQYRQIESHVQISVSPEDDVELRRVTLTNRSSKPRVLELTSFSEVALADPRAEEAHPVFNSLFIQTEIVPAKAAVLASRRPLSDKESPPWLFHAMAVLGDAGGEPPSFETDRARFIGRTRSAADPAALQAPGPLSNTAGSVLDPSLAMRRRIALGPGEAVTIDVITGVGKTRDEALGLIDRYDDRRLADRVFDLAWVQSQVLLHQLRATEEDARLFARFAGSLLFANARNRAAPSLLARNRRGQHDLWRQGISGDLPIVLLRVTDPTGADLARQMIQAHAYWRYKGLRCDLVLWADAFAGYRKSLYDQIVGMVNAGPEPNILDQHGGIFVRSTDQLSEDDRTLLQSVARLVLTDQAGTLAEQAERPGRSETKAAPFRPTRRPDLPVPGEATLPPHQLAYFNGLGGFTSDGREYVIRLMPGAATPAPWINVLANETFGSVVTESGGGYTWFENAHTYRLTPWHNDPVCDSCGEAYYVRDEETGQFWSPTPGPAAGRTPYVCRHGLGYTAFEHTQDGIYTEMMAYVAREAPVKLVSITLRNLSDRDRRLSVTGYVEWILGENRDQNAMHVVTRLDPSTGAILASSAYDPDAPNRVAFFHSSEPDRSVAADRAEFLGRNGSLAAPAAMRRRRLSDRVGAGLDPCAAIQSFVTVPAGEQRRIVFVLGTARSDETAHELVDRFAGTGGARQELEAVWEFWKHLLGGVYVETPDPAVNFLANHWLLYQTLVGRFWGRTGYYQSGGAFGFRDQLQDTMAFLHECPWLARGHLLRAAEHQFREGDVQHWWHPPSGRGVRTHCSDDLLWLPYAVCRYVKGTGDTGVLDEQVPFLEGRELKADEESYYDKPQVAAERASLYDHCVRAVRRGLKFGLHGLPLIGSGDWNDGLNRVGKEGRGESVWLAFFLYDLLERFGDLARRRDDHETATLCLETARNLKAAIRARAWDGRWYLRAYFDDGQPLGSAASPECCIDSLPQSWAVLSGAADPQRARMAMDAVLERLVDWDLRLIRLFDPPFDSASWDPGYIKGYIPGVRENGGQYTHAAVWVVAAFARLREADLAWRLFGLLNPILHGDTPQNVARYRVEPYVVAADVYTAKGHEGRGGWTWYTGSAGWIYRLLLEDLLGLSLEVDVLTLAPLLPRDWKGYAVHYRFRSALYHIHVTVAGPATWNVRSLSVDGADQADRKIHLADDGRDHDVRVEVG